MNSARQRTRVVAAFTPCTQVLNAYYTFSGDHSPNHVYMLCVPCALRCDRTPRAALITDPCLTCRYMLLQVYPFLSADDGFLVAMLHTLSTECCEGLSSYRA